VPHVSVVIPAFNRAETIAETFDSLLAQSFEDWEAVVVDDGSHDTTADIVSAYAARDRRFRLHRQANAGVSAARNTGIAEATAPWLMFLDADDWLAPDALTRLSAAAAQDRDVTLAVGGSVQMLSDGSQQPEETPPSEEELFLTFARTCAFSIHACIVQTARVRAVGGFDDTLVTCEDWDLWLRIARTLPRLARVRENVAYYRIRDGSASRAPQRLLLDGLRVIERAHRDEPRLAGWVGQLHPLPTAAHAATARLYFLAYVAGLEIGAGGDPLGLVPLVPDPAAGSVYSDHLAETLFRSIALGRSQSLSAWTSFPDPVRSEVDRFVAAIAEVTGNEWLPATTKLEFEQLVAEYAADHSDHVRFGEAELFRVCLGSPPEHRPLASDTGRVMLQLRTEAGLKEGTTLPACDRMLTAGVAADALLGERAWELLAALLETTAYPMLELERNRQMIRVRRGQALIAEGPACPFAEDRSAAIHSVAGWTVFLQELWGRPEFSSQEFYPGSARSRSDVGQLSAAGQHPAVVEIADELPALAASANALVEVTLAGLPLFALRIPAVDGVVTRDRLRRAITQAGKFELCRVAIRETVLLGTWPAATPLRERLRAVAARRTHAADTARPELDPNPRIAALLAEALPDDRSALLIGRRPGTPVGGAGSRLASFPAASAEAMATAARDAGQSVRQIGDSSRPTLGLYVPWLFDPASDRIALDPDASERVREFEDLFATRVDPWDYTSPYEERKYEDTLALLPQSAATGLELGCAEGFFTPRIASRTAQLTVVDISTTALERARERCAELTNIAYQQLDVFADPLPYSVDLIVCSEILYYLPDRGALRPVLRKIVDALRPGGSLITTHANVVVDEPGAPGFDWDVPLGASAIEAALRADRRISLVEQRLTPYYRAQRYTRSASPRRRLLPTRGPAPISHADDGVAPTPDVQRMFRPHGGKVDTSERDHVTSRLPVLMYHRIDADDAPSYRRWTTTPEAFEAQLAWLREHDFHAASIDEWSTAVSEDRPLTGRRVVITFDDGYAGFSEHALPRLESYGYSADLFVVSDHVGATNSWERGDIERFALMDWETLAALPERIVRIGSHTRHHPLLTTLGAIEATDELAGSRYALEHHLGRRVTAIAYPFGAADPAIQHLARAAGYEHAFTTHNWPAYPRSLPLAIPRLEVFGGISIDEFARLVRPRDA
jgi:peptidoglycan/xylan/chitin deacetylase (PgdA/CDA1 family)